MMRCIRYPAHFDTHVYDAKAYFNLLNQDLISLIRPGDSASMLLTIPLGQL
jgi:hypothetical protein